MTKYVIRAPGIDPAEIENFVFNVNLDVNFVHNRNMRIGNFEVARRAFKELVERHPGQAFAHYFLARCDDLLVGDGGASYRRYEQIVAEFPVWREAAERFGLEIEHDDTAASDRALQGAFDILNYGHIRAFKFAKAQGDYLIVALNTNELIRDYKGREPVMPWSQKRRIIEACRYVDRVVPAREFSPLELLKRYRVDVYVLSHEWEHTKAAEIAFMKQKGGRVCFSRRFAASRRRPSRQRC